MPSCDIRFSDGHEAVSRRLDCAGLAVATEFARGGSPHGA